MATLTHEATPSATIGTMARLDAFSLFIIGFMGFYAATSLGLEHVAGIIGFAKAPYLNAVAYLYTLAFIGGGVVLNRVTHRFLLPHPLAIGLLVCLFIAVVTGMANGNAPQYIVGWTLYLVTAVLAFQFFRNLHERRGRGEDVVRSLFSIPLLLVVLALAFLSIFNRDNHYQYVLFEVIALAAILLRPSIFEKMLGAAIYLMIHLGSNDGFIQVEINRASILAVGTVGVLFLLYRRHLVVLFFLIFAAIGGLLYAFSLDDTVVEDLPRNIKEAILLMKGDDIYNHTSSYQRVYEGQKVMEDYEAASDFEWLFGKGLGRTVDMTGAADKTPGQHALLGATEVHNIHFLHFAVFHKFGLAGLALVGALAVWIVGMFLLDLGRGRLTSTTMFFYFYLVYTLIFALPASNFLIANPLWPAFLAILLTTRGDQFHARIDASALPALTDPVASGRT